MNVGTVIVGSTQNLSAELLKSATGLDFRIVPFRNTPDLMLSLTRGDVDLMIDSYSALKSMIDDKQVRALASSGPTRSPVTPNLPTAAEAGVPGYDVTSWNAIFAPAGTPADVIAKMQKAIAEVIAEDEIKRKLLELGIEAKALAGAQLAKQLESDIVKWGDVITKANIPKN